MSSTTSEAVVKTLQRLFMTHGFLDAIVLDNSPQLTAGLFQNFLARHAIRHVLVAPCHPASNGLAERAVHSVKDALSKLGPGDRQSKISTYLLAQHTTPCPATLRSPVELLMGHWLHVDLDQLHPTYSEERPLDSSS